MSPFTRTHRALRQTRHMTSLPGTAAAATPESTHRAEGPDAAKTATADGTRDFRNIYRHGFARIVAATAPVRIADPATNAATSAAEVARLTGRGTGAGARATSADRAAGADAGDDADDSDADDVLSGWPYRSTRHLGPQTAGEQNDCRTIPQRSDDVGHR